MIAPLLTAQTTHAEFSLGLAGDIMLNGIKPSAKTFAGIQAELSRPDVCLANLEVPLTDRTISTGRKSAAELRARTQFILKADPKHAPFIAASGIDLVSMANNHAMDYGGAGIAQMQSQMTLHKITFAGAGQNASDAMQIGVFKLRNGVRVGLFSALAFVGRGALLKTTPATMTQPGINVLSFGGNINVGAKARIARIVAVAKTKCDFLVIGLHWGVERQTLPTSYQVSLGRAFAEAGANLVWGHHPHVLQGAELYRGVPIFYSMGNLISPTAAVTGIVHLRFRDDKMIRAYFRGVSIGGGRAVALSGPSEAVQRRRFFGLCEVLQKKYPAALSNPIFR